MVGSDQARGIRRSPVELARESTRQVVELPPHALAIYEQGEVAKFLATVSPEGVPNVVLIVSQMPVDPGKVAFGEFMMVKTLANLRSEPRVASLAMTEKLEMAGFKAELEYWTESGEYVDRINDIDLFRYNAYGGIHSVAVLDVLELLPLPEKVSFLKVGGDFAAMLAAGRPAGRKSELVPGPITGKFNGIMSIKVLAFLGEDGFPDVRPIFGVRLSPAGEMRFKISSYNERLGEISPGAPVATNVLTMDLLTYQLKGVLKRFEKRAGVRTGVVQLDKAYSCMPPLVGERIF